MKVKTLLYGTVVMVGLGAMATGCSRDKAENKNQIESAPSALSQESTPQEKPRSVKLVERELALKTILNEIRMFDSAKEDRCTDTNYQKFLDNEVYVISNHHRDVADKSLSVMSKISTTDDLFKKSVESLVDANRKIKDSFCSVLAVKDIEKSFSNEHLFNSPEDLDSYEAQIARGELVANFIYPIFQDSSAKVLAQLDFEAQAALNLALRQKLEIASETLQKKIELLRDHPSKGNVDAKTINEMGNFGLTATALVDEIEPGLEQYATSGEMDTAIVAKNKVLQSMLAKAEASITSIQSMLIMLTWSEL